MSSSDPKTTKPTASRTASGEEPTQTCGAADLQAALQRIASHIVDADKRHSKSLDDMQERLGQVGRQVDQARAAASEPHTGTLDRLEREIASLSERMATFGQERRSQRDAGGTPRTEAAAADDEPWDAQKAEALTQACETAQAELVAGRWPTRSSEPGKQAHAKRTSLPGPTREQAPPIDRAWLEARLAGIAAVLQQSLAENNPAKSLTALGQRLDQLETRLESMLGNVSARLGSDWIDLVEDHIKELSVHFEATSRQLARLDTIDGQLQQLSRTLDEQRQAAQAQPTGLREEVVEALIQTAAERAASRLAATLPAPEAQAGQRIDALEEIMQDYIAERRRGEETTSGMLQTIEEALIRIIDRIDAMDAPAPGAHADGDAPEASGMDLESERLAEAYATGARVLGHGPAEPILDAANYASSSERREEVALAREAPGVNTPKEAAADEATQTRQELRASAMRAKLKAQAAPEVTLPPSPPQLQAGPPLAGTKPPKSAGGSRSRLLIGGAMALLFTASYLTVDLVFLRDAPAGVQQSAAPKTQDGPHDGVAAGISRPSPQRTVADPPASKRKAEPVAAPEPAVRKTPEPTGDSNQVEQWWGKEPGNRHLTGLKIPEAARQPAPAAEPASVPPQDPSAAALQDGQLAAGDGAAPPGIDALPTAIGSAALRGAAAKGDMFAQFEVATRFAEGNGVPQDQKLAFAWYERAAMRGLASAQFRLGAYYERGIGVAIDAERAKVWYRRAADQGHVRAMHNLGVLVVGRGQEYADYAGAAHWFKEAAKRGYIDSQFNLATLYAHGRGVGKDLTESYMWFALAARAGDAGALRRLEEIKAQLDQPEQETAERKLVAWRPEGAAELAPSQADR